MIKSECLDLVVQLQLYLMQEYPSAQSWLEVSRESYTHYREFAKSLNRESIHKKNAEDKSPELKARHAEPESEKQETIPKREVEIKPAISLIQQPAPVDVPIKNLAKIKTSPALTPNAPTKIAQDFTDFRKLIADHFPEQVILSQPPDDSMAKATKNAWKTQPHHVSFLENLCKAIWIVFGLKTKVNGRNLQWGESTESIVELEDLDSYMREPKLKSILWKTLINKIPKR